MGQNFLDIQYCSTLFLQYNFNLNYREIYNEDREKDKQTDKQPGKETEELKIDSKMKRERERQ